LLDVERGLADAERAALLQDLAEIGALKELHRHEGTAVFEARDLDDAGDVRAGEAGRGACLAEEALDGNGVPRLVRIHELEGDALLRALIECGDDDAHSASTDDALDPEAAREHVSGRRVCASRLHVAELTALLSEIRARS
jgi:hypothetical protein